MAVYVSVSQALLKNIVLRRRSPDHHTHVKETTKAIYRYRSRTCANDRRGNERTCVVLVESVGSVRSRGSMQMEFLIADHSAAVLL